jgi:hypothetical protein
MKKFAGLFIAFAAVAFLSTACNKAEEAEVAPAETTPETTAPATPPVETTPPPADSAAAPATDSTSAQ